ncbi:hypothetical protein D3273_13790 [Lichenibacterium minor]|jgi:hypothetical protein|uniref:Uncharacterized protein n=1 Tax=Lichenibacterium minor TaxID=2316528 RepID=A0A4Q2U4G9_9HYPH|nr:DUF6101 family protein [Lichenibacterium minor]RYC31449.1 hypothetical protein D3273_13790 [Lichenibacterium minor]
MTSFAATGLFDRIADHVGAAPLQAADGRADNRRRSVQLSRERVTIDRSYRGIAMRLSVPVSAYQGVCVGVRAGEDGGFVYELRLAHRDPDLSVLLDEARDESRIWAEWRASAGFFGLPALVERNDGPEVWGAMAAPAECRDRRAKRRHRPGIVARRVARPEALGTVHREAEIIARD